MFIICFGRSDVSTFGLLSYSHVLLRFSHVRWGMGKPASRLDQQTLVHKRERKGLDK